MSSLPSNCPARVCACGNTLFSYQLEPFFNPPFANAQQSYTASCPMGYIGSPVTVVILAGEYFSYLSQADADAQALAAATAIANLGLSCTPPVYYNTQQCASCPSPSTEQYCVAAGLYMSTVSQAAANAAALAVAQANLACNIAGQLNGLRWSIPAITSFGQLSGCTDPADQVATLSGTPGHLYQVRLRFRGVTELRNYTGGTVDPAAKSWFYEPDINPTFFVNSGTFQTGGIPDPADNATNVYELIVSNPAQVYYLNRSPTGSEEQCALLDYEEVIPMMAGATVTLRARTLDNVMVSNITWSGGGGFGNYSQITVPGITNLLPNVGQFVQMDVIDIT